MAYYGPNGEVRQEVPYFLRPGFGPTSPYSTTNPGATTTAPKPAAPAPTQIDPALAARYRARTYIRDLMQHSGETALADQERSSQRDRAGLDDSLVSRGLYSTTLLDALRNRQSESSARARGALTEQIATGKASVEAGLDSGIADQFSHNEDRAQNYSFLGSQAKAEQKAQNKSSLFGFLGNLGGAAALAFL